MSIINAVKDPENGYPRVACDYCGRPTRMAYTSNVTRPVLCDVHDGDRELARDRAAIAADQAWETLKTKEYRSEAWASALRVFHQAEEKLRLIDDAA